MSNPRKHSFDRVMAGYYRHPDPDAAAEALAYALESDVFQKDSTVPLLFVRLAELHPEVKSRFRALMPSLGQEERKIVQMMIDPPDDYKDARYLSPTARGPEDLDLYWDEFLVTGSLDMVKRIIAVLDWKDLSRSLIDECLMAPDSAGIQLSDAQLQSFRELGILIGVTREGASLRSRPRETLTC